MITWGTEESRKMLSVLTSAFRNSGSVEHAPVVVQADELALAAERSQSCTER